ncbi:MAG: pilus assembly protein TadG-related protein, partial [Verrucomicrobiae bacterium]|nr:pilus assembly protein TadG-related protein [Verrucomicrobiae bacterium]
MQVAFVNRLSGQMRQRSKEGSTLVLVAVFMAGLLAFAALSVDVSQVLVNRKKMQEATDAAALAAVVDWARGATSLE